jgi:hypothetical protein
MTMCVLHLLASYQNVCQVGVLLKGMRKDRLRQRKREFEHATASGGRFPRMNELVLSYCSADGGVVEGYLWDPKGL